ncbi:MAG TPA: hypothetical protein VIA29_06515, partial [Thermoanaerobaculia bacterium]
LLPFGYPCPRSMNDFQRKCPFCGGDMLRSRSHNYGYTHYFWQKPWRRSFFGFGAERVYPWACMGCGVVLLYLARLPAIAAEYRTAGQAEKESARPIEPAPIKP